MKLGFADPNITLCHAGSSFQPSPLRTLPRISSDTITLAFLTNTCRIELWSFPLRNSRRTFSPYRIWMSNDWAAASSTTTCINSPPFKNAAFQYQEIEREAHADYPEYNENSLEVLTVLNTNLVELATPNMSTLKWTERNFVMLTRSYDHLLETPLEWKPYRHCTSMSSNLDNATLVSHS